ncbi:MAG: exonuclease domain-containing protein [Oscillospiraceae bacterium]|nr:exonuclease domain-containing protein [Oscillospiraceae bacterium]
MAYIVFDMEWNQPMCAAQPMKERNGVKLSGEIMQIGAIKLDDDCNIIGDFSLCVKPHFYKRLNKRVRELTGITKEELASADIFPAVFAQFDAFCGENPTLLSWGFDDVPILRQNLISWDLGTEICENSYNLQTIFNTQTDGGKSQRSLAFALEYFGIVPTLEAHDALHDAYHTALVAQKLDLKNGLASYGGGSSGALWEHPLSTDSFYPYPHKRAAFSDKALTHIPCPICRERLETSKWVTKGGNFYIALASCENHGDFIGRIKFSHVSDTALSAVRNVFKGSEFASEHYDAVFAKSEERKIRFKERMKEQKKAKKNIGDIT